MTMETFICRIRTHVLMTIIEGLFHSPQTLNGQVKKGTGSLIQHPGATTVKWSQIGAALTFLSNTPSLIQIWGKGRKCSPGGDLVSALPRHVCRKVKNLGPFLVSSELGE